MQRDTLAFDQALSPRNVLRRGGVVKSFDLQAMFFIPLAGADMQRVHAGGVQALRQPLPQQLGKEMVIAIPAPLAVQRQDE